MNTTVLFDIPQKEISTLINARLSQCDSASIITGFLTPSGVGAIADPIQARPNILNRLVVGASTYPGFQALDELLAMGVAPQSIRVHLGHTRESGTRNNPIVRHHPMLHSKIYYMELPGEQACAFVGSHNVTSFALQGLNGEAAILLEGPRQAVEFDRIRKHIQLATDQAVPYTQGMKEALAWWLREFLDGLRAEIGIPQDWSTVRTILIFAEASPSDRLAKGDSLYFELPAGIAIESLKTEAHLFLFTTLPPDPWQALQQIATAHARYTCKVLGAENEQGNLELKARWQIETRPTPLLRRVTSGVFRPTTQAGMQQVRAVVEVHAVTPWEYLFETEKVYWWPIFSDKEELHPEGGSEEPFPIPDTRWQKESRQPWKLVTGLKHSEGSRVEKDAAALELAKPESGSFVLVSLRRRRAEQVPARESETDSAHLREAIRNADDPLKPWPPANLLEALGLLPATRRALLTRLGQTKPQHLTLLEFMDLVLSDTGESTVNIQNSRLLGLPGVGEKGYWSAARALTGLDMGPRCNALWRKRIANLQGQWQITPPA